MLLASKIHDEDRRLAYQIAEYVANICQGIPKAFDLYSQASVLTASKGIYSSLVLAGATFLAIIINYYNPRSDWENGLYDALVPQIDLSMAQQVLNSRLESVDAFDEAYRNLRTQDATSEDIRLFANLALEKSVDSDRVYSFLGEPTKNRLVTSQAAFDKAQREFQALQLDLKNKQHGFRAGVEKWHADKTQKLLGNVFTAVVAVAGGITLACAAPPAAAAGIGAGAGKLESAIQVAKEVVSVWEEIGSIVDIIKDIYKKLKPYLEKMKELAGAIGQIADLVKSKSSMDGFNNKEIQGVTTPGKTSLSNTFVVIQGCSITFLAIQGEDSINIVASWDIFHLEMDTLHKRVSKIRILRL